MPTITVPNLKQVLSRGADANGVTLTNLGSPSSSTDAATKGYVDTAVSGATVAHNSTTSKQGGTTSEYYHLTSAEYTGSGTGVFARVASPTFTGTVGAASASLSGTMRLTGSSSVPTLSSDAYIYHTTTGGLVLMGIGSANDMTVLNGSGSNVFRIATGSTNTRFYGAIEPSSNDLCAVGSASRSFSDVFLADGAVLNFNNGNYTVTHSSGSLSFSGDIVYSKTGITTLLPNTSDGSDNKALTIGGGGAYTTTRGSGIACIGNEYSVVGGDLELLAGDSSISGAIKFYVGDGASGALLAGRIDRTTGALTMGTTAGTGTRAIYAGALSINNNGRVTVNNTNESTTLTDFTQSLTNAGLLINTEYTANAYTAGVFWATSNDNATVPKAGIWMRETGAGTLLYLGTSNNYAAGITSSVAIDQNGSMSVSSLTANTATILGSAGGTTGYVYFNGSTSGSVTLSVANTAGTWTMKLPTSAGSSGQFLQTDGSGNTTWATASGGGSSTQNVVTVRGSHFAYYSDSDHNIPTVLTSTFYLSTAGYASYKSGTAQSIAAGTIWASAAANGIILVSGYLYVFLISGGASRIYRCDVTADISASGNWTQLTISGTALPTAASSGIIGFDGTNFWVVDAGTKFMKYTLSGTTLTSNGTVTVTGSSYSLTYSRVNANGIYASFSAAPYIRVASLSGTLDSAKQILVAATLTFTNASGFYVLSASSSTDIYSLTNL